MMISGSQALPAAPNGGPEENVVENENTDGLLQDAVPEVENQAEQTVKDDTPQVEAEEQKVEEPKSVTKAEAGAPQADQGGSNSCKVCKSKKRVVLIDYQTLPNGLSIPGVYLCRDCINEQPTSTDWMVCRTCMLRVCTMLTRSRCGTIGRTIEVGEEKSKDL
eukprot:755483-Hanusia_phi.AAC.3